MQVLITINLHHVFVLVDLSASNIINVDLATKAKLKWDEDYSFPGVMANGEQL